MPVRLHVTRRDISVLKSTPWQTFYSLELQIRPCKDFTNHDLKIRVDCQSQAQTQSFATGDCGRWSYRTTWPSHMRDLLLDQVRHELNLPKAAKDYNRLEAQPPTLAYPE